MGDYEISKRTRLAIMISTVFAALLWLSFAVYTTLIRGVTDGPTLIEAVHSKEVTVDQIKNIQIIKAQPGVWEFSETGYKKLMRKQISDKEIIEKLVLLLFWRTKEGYTHRNHPSFCYKSYIKINLKNGNAYYLLIGVYKYKFYRYCSIDSLYRNTRNPNGGLHYENESLVQFLRDYDPWYR